MNKENREQLYRLAYQDGVRAARARCDVCPARCEDGEPALITGRDVLLRQGIEN